MEVSLEKIKVLSTAYILFNVVAHYSVSVCVTFPAFLGDLGYDVSSAHLSSPLFWVYLVFATFSAFNVIYNLRATVAKSKHSKVTERRQTSTQAIHSPSHSHSFTGVSGHSLQLNLTKLRHKREHEQQQRSSPNYWCDACGTEKPPRAHHCKICDVCILRRDHHCYVLGECIGLENQGHFILFLLHASSSLCFSSVLLFVYVSRAYLADASFFDVVVGQYYLFPLNLFRWLVWRDFSLGVVPFSLFLAASLLNAVVCGAYGVLQLFLVVQDLTWYEFRTNGRNRGKFWSSFFGRQKVEMNLGSSVSENTERQVGNRGLKKCFGKRWLLVPLFPFLLRSASDRHTRVKVV